MLATELTLNKATPHLSLFILTSVEDFPVKYLSRPPPWWLYCDFF